MPVPQQPTSAVKQVSNPALLVEEVPDAKLGGFEGVYITPNRPFFLMHHPGNWSVSKFANVNGKPVVIPDIHMFVLEPGVNGVRTIGRGEEPGQAYEAALYKLQTKGSIWRLERDIEIPKECLPPDVKPGSYMRRMRCKDPRSNQVGYRYIEAWMIPITTPPDKTQRFKFHKESYEKWRIWLIETGQLPPMEEYVLEDLTARKRAHFDRADGCSASDNMRARMCKMRQEIIDRHDTAVHPKVKRKGARA